MFDSVLVVCTFLGICPFYLSALIWHAVVHSFLLTIIFIFVASIVMALLSFLILLIDSNFSFSLGQFSGNLVNFVDIFKEPTFGFLVIFNCFSFLYFVNFSSFVNLSSILIIFLFACFRFVYSSLRSVFNVF